jgi:hypothetical protein
MVTAHGPLRLQVVRDNTDGPIEHMATDNIAPRRASLGSYLTQEFAPPFRVGFVHTMNDCRH